MVWRERDCEHECGHECAQAVDVGVGHRLQSTAMVLTALHTQGCTLYGSSIMLANDSEGRFKVGPAYPACHAGAVVELRAHRMCYRRSGSWTSPT